MKNLKRYLSFLAVFALLFTSCSKEEAGMANSDSEKATLSFGAIVNDLVTNRAASKQAIGDLPDCSDDTPAYVRVVLMQGEEEILGTSTSPYRVDLVAGQVFTVEDENLELEPGDYTLEHFAVYNSDNEVIWIAPRAGSDLAGYVDRTLPIDIDLRAGVKKYVDVPVLCFDNREVNQYGYLFFELDTNVALTYCFFANYCNEDGMHYPARYSISIWSGDDATGVALYTNETNNTGMHSNGDYFATPLCIALPDNEDLDEEYLYYEMTLLDWDENYGDVEQVMMSGTITKREILANFGEGEEDNIEYEHVRFCDGAGEPVGDRDNDNIPDNVDECPDEAGPASNNGCPEDEDGDADGDGVVDSIDECPDTPAGTDVDEVGCPIEDGDSDGDGVVDSIDECPNTPAETDVDAVGCPIEDGDSDGDGVVDSIDECPNTPAGTDVDAVGCPIEDGDSDGDGVVDSIDECPNTPAGTDVDAVGCPIEDGDSDGDGVVDSIDECPNTPAGTDVDAVGCPIQTDPCAGLPAVCDVDFGTLEADCYVVELAGADDDGYILVNGPGTIDILQSVIGEDWGDVVVAINNSGSVTLSIDGDLPSDKITAYEIAVVKSDNGAMSSTCRESQCDSSVEEVTGDQPAIQITFDALDYTYPFYLRVNTVICETPVIGE